jgi:5-methylcytosine-specific restriction enzyme subunit McrC
LIVVLTCTEHTSYRWEELGATADKAIFLALLPDLPKGAIDLTYNGFRTTSYCGLIQVGQKSIEILPKITPVAGYPDADKVNRQLLVAMLGVVYDFPTWQKGGANSGTDDHLLPFLIRAFLREAEFQLERGLYMAYVIYEDRLVRPRGRLLFAEMLRAGPASAPGLICEFDELTIDNAYNQAILHALYCARRSLPGAHRLGIDCERMITFFSDVSRVLMTTDEIAKLPRNRLTARYDRISQLAAWIIQAIGPEVHHGEQRGLSLLFDMNALFEEYVGRMCQRALKGPGFQANLQGPIRALAKDEKDKTVFNLKPDIVISSGLKPEIVVDTKWKRLEHSKWHDGVAQSDIYQMHAYARRYGVSEVVLLYPHHQGLVNKKVGRWSSFTLMEDDTSMSKHKITVATLDLNDLNTVPDQLQELFVDLIRSHSLVCSIGES